LKIRYLSRSKNRIEGLKMNNFKEEIIKTWIDTGGLITKKLASKIAGIAESQILRRIELGELKEYKVDGIKTGFVAFKDALKIERKRKKKGIKKE